MGSLVDVADVEDLNDALVGQEGRRFGLVDEYGDELGAFGQMGVKAGIVKFCKRIDDPPSSMKDFFSPVFPHVFSPCLLNEDTLS
jgi:hypothetical protein